jgi:hypothetical protein
MVFDNSAHNLALAPIRQAHAQLFSTRERVATASGPNWIVLTAAYRLRFSKTPLSPPLVIYCRVEYDKT